MSPLTGLESSPGRGSAGIWRGREIWWCWVWSRRYDGPPCQESRQNQRRRPALGGNGSPRPALIVDKLYGVKKRMRQGEYALKAKNAGNSPNPGKPVNGGNEDKTHDSGVISCSDDHNSPIPENMYMGIPENMYMGKMTPESCSNDHNSPIPENPYMGKRENPYMGKNALPNPGKPVNGPIPENMYAVLELPAVTLSKAVTAFDYKNSAAEEEITEVLENGLTTNDLRALEAGQESQDGLAVSIEQVRPCAGNDELTRRRGKLMPRLTLS
jgi:hypothetical protein